MLRDLHDYPRCTPKRIHKYRSRCNHIFISSHMQMYQRYMKTKIKSLIRIKIVNTLTIEKLFNAISLYRCSTPS